MQKDQRSRAFFAVLVLVSVAALSLYAAPPDPRADSRPQLSMTAAGQHPQSSRVTVTGPDGAEQVTVVRYLLYLPEAYGKDPGMKWPVILFLHGRGERGDDLEMLKKHPLPETLAEQADFPFIVVSPQLPLEMQTWSPMIEPLNALLDQIQTRYSSDPSRIYLTGLSLGGFGTWEFGLRHPRRFAAVAPIAGGYYFGSRGIPPRICDLKAVPLWVFHGALDETVEPYQSEVLVDALRACGARIRFTLYGDADHEASWRRAYADPELYRWLLSNSLGR